MGKQGFPGTSWRAGENGTAAASVGSRPIPPYTPSDGVPSRTPERVPVAGGPRAPDPQRSAQARPDTQVCLFVSVLCEQSRRSACLLVSASLFLMVYYLVYTKFIILVYTNFIILYVPLVVKFRF